MDAQLNNAEPGGTLVSICPLAPLVVPRQFYLLARSQTFAKCNKNKSCSKHCGILLPFMLWEGISLSQTYPLMNIYREQIGLAAHCSIKTICQILSFWLKTTSCLKGSAKLAFVVQQYHWHDNIWCSVVHNVTSHLLCLFLPTQKHGSMQMVSDRGWQWAAISIRD